MSICEKVDSSVSSNAPGIGDAPYVSTCIDAMRSGLNSGWLSSIWIIVGTITVIVTPAFSVTSSTAAGSNIGTNVVTPPAAGTPSTPPSDAAWNIGVWWRYTNVSSNFQIVLIL